jgi:lipopolysaccharide biosynthesis glycosyltransferase
MIFDFISDYKITITFYTIAINRVPDIFKHTIPTIEDYALKCDCDFIIRDKIEDHVLDNDFDYKNIIMEKFAIKKLLKKYDRVLYIDADILIKNDALDIFKQCPDKSYVYMYNEVKYNNVEYDRQIETAVKTYKIKWSKNEHYDWYNAGVMLVSQGQADLFNFNKDEYFIFPDMPMLVDMPYLHYNLYKYNIPIKELSEEWNTMQYFKEGGYFMHFANVLNRNERILDYVHCNRR